MILVIENYNIEKITIQIIKKCIEENSDITLAKISEKLGISERTLYRINLKHNIYSIKNRKLLRQC